MIGPIITGSKAFFCDIPGFVPKDDAYIYIVEPNEVEYKWKNVIRRGNSCYFYIVRHSVEELINHAIMFEQSMSLCHFIQSVIADELGVTITHLPSLAPLRERLDEEHEYLGVIFDFYLENEEMTLSNEQLTQAYEAYKNARL